MNISTTWKFRAAIAAVMLLLVAVLVGVGVLLANSYGASTVAANARQLHWANASAGSLGITRAAVAQAVFFESHPTSDERATDNAVAEAFENINSTSEIVQLAELDDATTAAIIDYIAEAGEVVDLVVAGEGDSAEVRRQELLEPQYFAINETLTAYRADLVQAINESDQAAGRIAQITFVVIAFLMPAVTMLVFWLLVRKRVRERSERMHHLVEKERDLNRAKDELIAGLSHELRTPITSIVGFSGILLEDPNVSDETRELVSMINASSADLARMVNDLLIAARIDAGALTMTLAEIDLADEVQAVVAIYELAGEAPNISVPSIKAYADPLRVRQTIHNLVSNALRHGGERVVVTGRETSRGPALVVADNGPGMPPEMEGKIFERFANGGRDAVVAGSVGLGLAISRELAVQMGGDLEYQRVDGWTTFTLRLRPYIGDLLSEVSQLPSAETELVS